MIENFQFHEKRSLSIRYRNGYLALFFYSDKHAGLLDRVLLTLINHFSLFFFIGEFLNDLNQELGLRSVDQSGFTLFR